MAYDAFISYNQAADTELAVALQTGLQRLAKSWHRLRALRVFRDQSVLSANPHLWASIEAAIGESHWYVLLASPEAAASEWVNRELDLWLATKGPDRILLVVTDGTCAWSDTTNTLEGDAVPASLHTAFVAVPRHVDLRWARSQPGLGLQDSRFRDAVAQLAAPIHGVAKDDLESEEVRQHRRARRLARGGITALALLLVIALTTTVLAVVQTARAERGQRRANESRKLAELRAAAAVGFNQVDSGEDVVRGLLLTAAASRQSDDVVVSDALLRALEHVEPRVRRYLSPQRLELTLLSQVRDVEVSPDGSLVAIATDGQVYVVRVADGRLLNIPSLPGASSVVFSGDGHRLLLQTEFAISVVDLTSGRTLLPMTRNLGGAPALDRTGTHVALVTGRGFNVVDAATGKERRVRSQFDFDAIALSPDGTKIAGVATVGGSARAVQLNAFSGAVLASTAFPLDRDCQCPGTGVSYDETGSTVTLAGANRLMSWRPTGRSVETTLYPRLPGTVVDLSRDRRRALIAVGADGERADLRVVDISTGATRADLGQVPGALDDGLVSEASDSIDAVARFAGSNDEFVVEPDQHALRIVDASPQPGSALVSAAPLHSGSGWIQTVSSDGRVAAAATSRGGSVVWSAVDAVSGRVRNRLDLTYPNSPEDPREALIVPGSHRLVVVLRGRLFIWDLDKNHRLASVLLRSDDGYPITSFSSDGNVLGLEYQSLSAPNSEAELPPGPIEFRDSRTGALLSRTPRGFFGSVLGYSTDGRTAFVSVLRASSRRGLLRTVAVDVHSGHEVRSELAAKLARFTGTTRNAPLFQLSADNVRVAVADIDRTTRSVVIGDLASDRVVATIHNVALGNRDSDEGEILLAPNGATLATYDGSSVQVWDSSSGLAVGAPLGSSVFAPFFTADGRELVWMTHGSASDDGELVRVPVTASAWRALACSVAGRDLTRAEWGRYAPDVHFVNPCSTT